MVIRQKTDPDHRIALRVHEGALEIVVDPDGSSLGPDFGGRSPQASPLDANRVSESGLTAAPLRLRVPGRDHPCSGRRRRGARPPFGIHAGVLGIPLRPNWRQLGLTGHAYMIGKPETGAGDWLGQINSVSSARIRVGDSWLYMAEGGAARGAALAGAEIVPPFVLTAVGAGGGRAAPRGAPGEVPRLPRQVDRPRPVGTDRLA